MQLLLSALLSLNVFALDSAANGFLCDSKTAAGEVSTLKVSANSGDVSINYGNEWLSLYTTGIYCGLKMKAVNCKTEITHNLDNTNKTQSTLISKYNCKIGGIDMVDANGYLEINLSGDGNGYFICGRFSKNDLLLSNCQTTSL